METGTGKTYVYLRTIFELNRRYGFTKFVIVVPSIAIKEGVHKTLAITEDHFRALYAGVPYDYFLYDSAKLGAPLRGERGDPDHGDDGGRDQQEGNQQPLQGQREDRRREADRPDPRDAADRDRRRAAKRRRRAEGRGREALRRDGAALHAALFGHARRPSPHGVPARRGRRVRAQAGQADRDRVGDRRGCAQQAVRAARGRVEPARRDQRARRSTSRRRPA